MKELLERDAVLNCFHDWIDKRGDVYAADDMQEYRDIEALPIIELVYCKDCKKHNKGSEATYVEEMCPLVLLRGRAQGHEFDYQYCAYGARKE